MADTPHTQQDPVAVVQAQLDAYNARDIERFCACFAPDAQLFDLGSPTPTTVGLLAIRQRYQALFDQSPALHSRVLSRSALGAAVVDVELITGRLGRPEPMHLMMVFEVHQGLIQRAYAVRE